MTTHANQPAAQREDALEKLNSMKAHVAAQKNYSAGLAALEEAASEMGRYVGVLEQSEITAALWATAREIPALKSINNKNLDDAINRGLENGKRRPVPMPLPSLHTARAAGPPEGINAKEAGSIPASLSPASVNLDAALTLGRAGNAVFPCGTDKRPTFVASWRAWSTTDENILREAFERHNAAVPAIDCGKSNLLVIDADRKPDAPDGVAHFVGLCAANNDALHGVPRVNTPGGGVHYIFSQPEGETLGNSPGALGGRGVDARGVGGYILAPSATLPDGRCYEYAEGSARLENGPPPPPPQWLLDLLRRGKRPATIKNKSSAPRGEGASGMGAQPDNFPTSPPRALTPEQIEHAWNIARRSLDNTANASPGTSNATINKEAHTLAGLVAAGVPAEGLYDKALEAAMERAAKGGNDPRKTQATFDSGWTNGLANPLLLRPQMPAAGVKAAQDSVARAMARQEVDRVEVKRKHFPVAGRFKLEAWKSITFDKSEEWLVKHILPRRGVAALYGKPGSYKSFVALYIAVSIASGRQWAGRRVTQAPVVYLAAEGAAGLRKRKVGFERAHPELSSSVPFYMIAAAPNLGTAPGDVGALGEAIEGAGVAPGLIVIDTLAQTLGSADENGSGMTAFVANAGEIASRFKCLVLIVHHAGLSDDKRLRGHSSLSGALDTTVLCERAERDYAATLTLQKLKDEGSDICLVARLSRIVIGQDEDGDDISTLIVETIDDAAPNAKVSRAKSAPPTQRLLMAVIAEAIERDGKLIRPYNDDTTVRAVSDNIVRSHYYARIAEQAEPDEDREKLANRQRRNFSRSVEAAIKAQRVNAAEHNGRRVLWLP
ncbi:AAA family ATPase [Methylocystis sp.]|uniref:AAA family ATPase n=1 Tax=Methylocystis sp. TaxID=1911079 RepID=UPI003D0CA82A